MVEEFQKLKTMEIGDVSMKTSINNQRRDHLTIFFSLLDYLEKEEMVINHIQSELFKHQIRKEEESLISAYEVYLNTNDLEDFVETLFIIYQ